MFFYLTNICVYQCESVVKKSSMSDLKPVNGIHIKMFAITEAVFKGDAPWAI